MLISVYQAWESPFSKLNGSPGRSFQKMKLMSRWPPYNIFFYFKEVQFGSRAAGSWHVVVHERDNRRQFRQAPTTVLTSDLNLAKTSPSPSRLERLNSTAWANGSAPSSLYALVLSPSRTRYRIKENFILGLTIEDSKGQEHDCLVTDWSHWLWCVMYLTVARTRFLPIESSLQLTDGPNQVINKSPCLQSENKRKPWSLLLNLAFSNRPPNYYGRRLLISQSCVAVLKYAHTAYSALTLYISAPGSLLPQLETCLV